MVDFGRKLKELRIQAGLSQKQLAERVTKALLLIISSQIGSNSF